MIIFGDWHKYCKLKSIDAGNGLNGDAITVGWSGNKINIFM
jgi:hypothetical protein